MLRSHVSNGPLTATVLCRHEFASEAQNGRRFELRIHKTVSAGRMSESTKGRHFAGLEALSVMMLATKKGLTPCALVLSRILSALAIYEPSRSLERRLMNWLSPWVRSLLADTINGNSSVSTAVRYQVPPRLSIPSSCISTMDIFAVNFITAAQYIAF